MMNPYYSNPYQYQINQPTNAMSGRMVNDFNEITVNDVPMNGNPAVFIRRDASEIQVRTWTPQGTISMSSYKPVIEPLTPQISNASQTDIQSQIEALATRLDKVESSISTKASQRSKKESENND